MIVSVFVRRLKPGATFQDFVREWEADAGFGVPTRVFNAQSLTDPREIISIGFVAVGAEQVTQWLSDAPASEAVRHVRAAHRTRLLAPAGADRGRVSREPAGRTDLRRADQLARCAPYARKGLPANRDDPPSRITPSP